MARAPTRYVTIGDFSLLKQIVDDRDERARDEELRPRCRVCREPIGRARRTAGAVWCSRCGHENETP